MTCAGIHQLEQSAEHFNFKMTCTGIHQLEQSAEHFLHHNQFLYLKMCLW